MGATKEQAEITKENILKGALKIFAEKGLAKTRLEDIAKEVGVTRGAIYWHFENKLDLFNQLFKNTLKIVLEDAGKIMESELSPLEKIRALLIHLGVKSIEDEDYQAISRIFNYQAGWPDGVSQMMGQLSGRAEEKGETILLKTINEGIESGEIKGSVDARIIGKTVIMFLHGFSSAAAGHLNLFKKEEIAQAVDVFLDGVRNH